jgi:hypothetical protein
MYSWLRGARFVEGKLVEQVHYRKKDGTIINLTREYSVEDLPVRLRDYLTNEEKK